MSAYGKPQPPPNLQGFDNGRTYADTQFAFNTSVYGNQASASVSSNASPVYQNSAQITQMAYNSNQARTPYDDQSGPYLHVGSTPIPEVTSYAPSRGSRGDRFSVFIASLYELQTASSPSFYLTFGNSRCGAMLTKLGQQGATCSYTVTAEVPQFTTTRWSSAEVPVFMFMETGDGDVMAKITVGSFTFTENMHSGMQQSAQELSRKRKISTDSTELMRSPIKRVSKQLLRPKEEYSSYDYISANDPARYSPYVPTNTAYSQNAVQQRYNQVACGYQSQGQQPRNLTYSYSNSTTSSPKIKTQQQQVANWSPSYQSTGSSLNRSPGLPSSAALSRPGLSSSSNPPLIRTTTIQTSSPAATPGTQYNAYALFPHKAKLEINGDLDSMAQNWSEEEWEAKRRLVHFTRSQSGSTITASFQPVSAEDKNPDNIYVSCIYWEEKNECFVTSVDTISLLEHLVAARFTVEEKNRIRRNLEGFRPLTVSKGKTDSEEFFKVIMAFPAPKPRNIEKDVKAFHWKDLGAALKKIIGKYSASPSSTLPPAALATPVSSTGYTTEGSSAGISYVDHHGGVSPRSIAGSATSTAYTGNIPARVVSPHNQKPLATMPGGSDVRVPVPLAHPHEVSGQQWPGSSNHNTHHMATSPQYPPQQHQQHLGNQAQAGRGSWDMASYLENSVATAGGTPGSASLMGYGSQNSNPTQASNAMSSTRNAADNAVLGGENRIVRTPSLQNSHQIPRV